MNIEKDKKQNLVLDLLQACKSSNMEKIKYYLTSPLLENKPSINDSSEMYKNHFTTPLMVAVSENNMELTKYLLFSPDLKTHANINLVCNENCALSIAITSGLENMVQYLLFSLDLKENANVFPTYKTLELIFKNRQRKIKEKEHLCSNNIHLFNMIESQPQFKNNRNLVDEIINDSLDNLFLNKSIDMLSYLLTNKYIEKKPTLESYLEKITDRNFYNDALKLINIIVIKNDLDKNLYEKSNTGNKIKL